RTLCTDTMRITVMAMAAVAALLAPSLWGPVSIIVIAGMAGLWLFKPAQQAGPDGAATAASRRAATLCLALFIVLLIGLPVLTQLGPNPIIAVIDAFFRAGSLVFGGGHVVLPLLQAQVVPSGWVTNDVFL